jgi:hypothetical protein
VISRFHFFAFKFTTLYRYTLEVNEEVAERMLDALLTDVARELSGGGWHFPPVDDSQYGPCNQSDNPRE